jgi:hypothetical protein
MITNVNWLVIPDINWLGAAHRPRYVGAMCYPIREQPRAPGVRAYWGLLTSSLSLLIAPSWKDSVRQT